MEQMLNAQCECRKCGKVVSYKQYKSDRFCPDCGTLLPAPRQPKCWVFQFNPAIYRWFDRKKENGESEQWLTSQHARAIHKRDKVAIWSSGDQAGIYALGEVESDPSKRPLSPEQEKYYIEKADVHKFLEKKSVTISYLKVIIDRPLLEDTCRRDSVLSTMEIFKHPQGTNFPLTREQWNRISELIE